MKPVLVDVGDRFWTNPWRSISPIKLRVEYTDTQFEFKFKAPSTSTLQIYDGDGTMTEVTGQDSTLVTHNTSYATPGTYYFYVEGDYVDLTVLNIAAHSFVSGDISRWGVLTNLTFLIAARCDLYGSVEALKTCTSITILTLQNNPRLFGDASTLSVLGNVTCSLYDTAVTFDNVVDMTKTGGSAEYGKSSVLTSAMIDNIFNSYKDSSSPFRIEVWGNSAKRTSASNAAIISLIQDSCKVGFDYVDTGLGVLGIELHTDANAASIDNEAGATTGWTPTGLSGDNEFISQSAEKTTGSYALKAQCNETPTANAKFQKEFTVTAERFYRMLWDWKHVGEGESWATFIEGGAFIQIQTDETEWNRFEAYYKAPDTSFEMRFTEYNTDNNGGIYVDNFSFKEITFE